MKLARWGNSFALRVPAALVKKLGLSEGDDVTLLPGGEKTLLIDRSDDEREAALARLKALTGQIPAGFRFDRDEIYDQRN